MGGQHAFAQNAQTQRAGVRSHGHGNRTKAASIRLAAAYWLHYRPLFLACILLLGATSFGRVAAQTQCTTFTPSASAFPVTWTVYQNWTFSEGPPTTFSY